MKKKKQKKEEKQNQPDLQQPQEKKKYPWWFYAIGFSFPVIFLLLLEAGLRLFNYGREYEVFSELSEVYPGMLFLNPDITHKYFVNLESPPGTIPDGFYREKKPNTFRVFVLGESSTAGWPYVPNASFPRYIRRKLQKLYINHHVEVINLGVSAISSYTILDFAKAAAEHDPDLVLVYTGHNEYYGALGAGSTQSLGASRWFINTMLSLQEYKTVQLLQNSIKGIWSAAASFGDDAKGTTNETLMARMIGESLIPYGSPVYENGKEQFRGNLEDILEVFREKQIPVILSSVASNLKDLPPFIPGDTSDENSAGRIYVSAGEKLFAGDTAAALKLYSRARDLDPLRFRASSDMNQIIRDISQKFNTPFVDAESELNRIAEAGITGADLMTDHLHPNIRGYSYIGELFFEKMKELSFLPGKEIPPADIEKAVDSILADDFPFTPLDSVIVDLRLRILLGGYPFVPRGEPNLLVKNFVRKNRIDSLAAEVVDRIILWEDAHYRMAEYYLQRGDIYSAEKEIRALVQDRPQNKSNYEQAARMFIEAGMYDDAMRYLVPIHKLGPTEYSYKWMGAIYLQQGVYKRAVDYLSGALKFNQQDPQVWYNLAGAYYYNGRNQEAIDAVKRCIQIDPQNTAAKSFYIQLSQITGLK
ncbi:MAG: GDSL-type esterase/lipase family protein [Ignavibacteriaceae bacterium]|nr:GDSL-type esterase/lipase family protein [Ignavibacteriaceae bacterium]